MSCTGACLLGAFLGKRGMQEVQISLQRTWTLAGSVVAVGARELLTRGSYV